MESVFFASNPHRCDGHVERLSFVQICTKLSVVRDFSGELDQADDAASFAGTAFNSDGDAICFDQTLIFEVYSKNSFVMLS